MRLALFPKLSWKLWSREPIFAHVSVWTPFSWIFLKNSPKRFWPVIFPKMISLSSYPAKVSHERDSSGYLRKNWFLDMKYTNGYTIFIFSSSLWTNILFIEQRAHAPITNNKLLIWYFVIPPLTFQFLFLYWGTIHLTLVVDKYHVHQYHSLAH